MTATNGCAALGERRWRSWATISFPTPLWPVIRRVASDLARLDLTEPIDLQVLKRARLDALDSVEPFVASRPVDEVGCLYYSAASRRFVDPREATDAVPHFGRPGGVLPRIADS